MILFHDLFTLHIFIKSHMIILYNYKDIGAIKGCLRVSEEGS